MSSLTIRVDPELEKKLGEIAADRELTRSEVVREALERLVRDHERELPLKQVIAEYQLIFGAESIALAEVFAERQRSAGQGRKDEAQASAPGGKAMKRGEVWIPNLNPNRGTEVGPRRPPARLLRSSRSASHSRS